VGHIVNERKVINGHVAVVAICRALDVDPSAVSEIVITVKRNMVEAEIRRFVFTDEAEKLAAALKVKS
jgi:Mn-dependent DtxR family transcriptional regulator